MSVLFKKAINTLSKISKHGFVPKIKFQIPTRTYSSKMLQRGKSMFKLGLAGIVVGGVVGTGYTIYLRNQPRSHIMNKQSGIPLLDEIPKINPSRKIHYPNDNNNLKLTLYQYQTCPFCCKVRAFLDYHGISYDVIEVDPVLRQSIKWSPYKKVPILVVETPTGQYQPLNDSSMIISALSTFIKDAEKEIVDIVKCYPFIEYVDEGGSRKTDIMNKYFLMLSEKKMVKMNMDELNEERKWRRWVDDVLVHTLSPNVYRTKEEAFQAFNWFSEVGEWEKNFPEWERQLIIYVGAYAMLMIGKRLKKKYNLKDDVRSSLYDECNYWMKSIQKKGGKFMGGDKPNLADLAVFGVLNSIEGCLAFEDLLKNSKIKVWFDQMKIEVNRNKMITDV
ncbi:prostaglandin E synthase 2 isoform X1 [Harmonia axyridis]|uniref:prostaglandin E synthase 2 isoform X1 n=2 Tax=Harmonia axyridis TaxID=115357 RepID=UPI001E27624F|nr:prostaglandin E synthase 2 isoform X1 [Harmonia axyridis]